MATDSSTGTVTKDSSKPSSAAGSKANAPRQVPVKGLVIGKPVTGRTLPPVSGKGRRPTPCPADLREAAEESLNGGGIAVPASGTIREIDKLKRDLKKYRLAQSAGGRVIQIDYRAVEGKPKPSANESGDIEFFVTHVSGPNKPV